MGCFFMQLEEEALEIMVVSGGLNFSTTFHRSVFAQCCVAISLLIFKELTSIEISI